jgi:hypothetical protein
LKLLSRKVGGGTLDLRIGVRVPASQPITLKHLLDKTGVYSDRFLAENLAAWSVDKFNVGV